MIKAHDEVVVGGVHALGVAMEIVTGRCVCNQSISPVFSSLIFQCSRVGPLFGADGE